jgi:ribosomal protein S18 acetylase RimI-like enzyme
MAESDVSEMLTAYDVQLRRVAAGLPPGWQADLLDEPAPLLRLTAPEETGWGDGVVWSDLDEDTADAAIAAVVDYFAGLGRSFEWKHHGYDRPADLPQRLRRAGFEADAEEALVAGRVDDVRRLLAGAAPPRGVTLRRLSEDAAGREADWRGIQAMHEAVWDDDATGLVTAVSTEHAADPEAMSVHLAVADDGSVVSAAWIRFHPGTEFASLWGGSTLVEYRRRGIYKALVARRVAEAAERGYRFVQVDASDDSRPILERLGLRRLTSTTPFLWHPQP